MSMRDATPKKRASTPSFQRGVKGGQQYNTVRESSRRISMSGDDEIVGIIEEVGDTLFLKQKGEGGSECSTKLSVWMEEQGITECEEPLRIASRLATFNFCLKIALYREYQAEDWELPEIDNSESAYRGFQQIYKQKNVEAFRKFPLDELALILSEENFNSLEEAASYLPTTENACEDVGRLFEKIVPNVARNKLGQFRTPLHVAEFMASWAVCESDDVVLDPGMGAGVLTGSVYAEKQRRKGGSSIEEIWGADISQLASVMSTTALKLLNGEGTPHIWTGDFLETVPESEPQSRIKDEANANIRDGFDAIVSNPPYSRHHNLKNSKKWEFIESARKETGLQISGFSPLYLYFFLHSSRLLSTGGRMAFLTPCEFMDNGYGEQLKRFLLDQFSIKAFIMPSRSAPIFDTGRSTSCLTLLRKGTPECQETAFVELKEQTWPDTGSLVSAIEGELTNPEWGQVHYINQSSLDPSENWTNNFDPDSVTKLPSLKPFDEFATIKRGIATGMNDYFCLTQDDVENRQLDTDRHLVPVIRRSKDLSHPNFTKSDWEALKERDETVYLLYNTGDLGAFSEEVDDAGKDALQHLRDYIEYGEGVGANDTHLASQRQHWHRIDRREIPDILCDYMSRNGFTFYENEANVRSLNNLHNIVLPPNFSTKERRALLAYLNSNIIDKIIEQTGRTHSDSLHKVEPGELKNIPVLNPKITNGDIVDELSTQFERFCQVSREDADEGGQAIIAEIDRILNNWFSDNDLL